jgi:predicted nuclease with TOPRIM domain
MKEQLEKRLTELKAEFESGQKVLAELEAKQASVRETLLRISGAIQVLEELLNSDAEAVENGQEQPEENTTEVA